MELASVLSFCAEDLVNATQVVVFTGAGMSADSGINTFRGSSSGFWSGALGNLALFYFGTPLGWKLSPHFAFRKYLTGFYAPIARAKPNAGHYALGEIETLLKERNPDVPFSVITMNVDGYHQRAGSTAVYEVHGTVTKNRCIKYGHKMELNLDQVEPNQLAKYKIPRCSEPGCRSWPRPDCVLFGEGLPAAEWTSSEMACDALTSKDVMLVIGTSNKVYPAAGLPETAERNGCKVYYFDIVINKNVEDDKMVVGKAADSLQTLLAQVKDRIATMPPSDSKDQE